MDYREIYLKLNEFETTAHKKLVKMFKDFNKKFFKDELPEVEIKITNKNTKDSKGIAGSFNFPPEAKVNSKIFKLKDLRKKGNALKDLDKEVYDFIVSNSYIEVPKDCVKKGIYYCAAILLHEMTHEYIELISKSSDTDMHGKDFRKKVDEINKKSNNEYRVPYEEVPDILKSDKPIDKRPEDINESLKHNIFERILKESLSKEQLSIYKKIFINCGYDINKTCEFLVKNKKYDILNIAPSVSVSEEDLIDINEEISDYFYALIDKIEKADLLKDFEDSKELYKKLKNTNFETVYTCSPALVTSTSAFSKLFLDNTANFDIDQKFLGLTVPYKDDGNTEIKVVISYLTAYLKSIDKYIATIAHEIAHALEFYIYGTLSHGKEWNECAAIVMKLFTKKPIVISEKANDYFDEIIEE